VEIRMVTRMVTRTSRSVRFLLASAAMFATGFSTHALAQDPAGGVPSAAQTGPAAELTRASELAAQGKLVQAKALLDRISEDRTGLSDDEVFTALQLRTSVSKRIKALSPVDVSIQTAENALTEGDLRTALRQAAGAVKSDKATSEQVAQAQKLHDQASERRDSMGRTVPAALKYAMDSIDAAKFADGKAALRYVSRSGVELSGNDRKVFDEYQSRVVELEISRGRAFEAVQISPAMFDPGVVERRTPPTEVAPGNTAEKQPDQQVPPAPAEGQPASQPATPPADAQPAPAPAPAPAGEDPTTLARRLSGQEILAEADRAFNDAQYREAITKYSNVLDNFREYLSAEQVTRADRNLQEARLQIRSNASPADLASDVETRNRLIREQAEAEYRNRMEQSRKSLASGDIAAARDQAAAARVGIAGARDAFPQGQVDAFNAEVLKLQQEISATEETMRTRALTEDEIKQAADAAAKARDARDKKEQQIKEMIDRVRALQLELKYTEALQIVDQILFLDPINPAGLLLRDVLSDARLFREYNKIQGRINNMFGTARENNGRATIADPEGIVTFSDDWPAISAQRGEPLQFAESPENLKVLSVLDTKRAPARFDDNSLKDVLDYFRNVANVNMDVDWGALETANITQDTTVTLSLTNVPIKTAMDRIFDKLGEDAAERPGWAVEDGVLVVSTQSQLNKRKSTEIYDVRDLLIEVPDYTDAPQFDLNAVLGGSQGGGQSPFRQTNNQRQNEDRRTLQERAEDVINLITQLVDYDGWRENGGDVGFINNYQGSLIITNTPKNHRAISGLLSKLRGPRSMQINVETRFLLVSEDFFEQIGVDLDVYFNSDNNQIRTMRNFDPTLQASDLFNFSGNGLRRFVNSNDHTTYNVPNINPTGQATANAAGQPVALPQSWSPIGAGQNSLGLGQTLASQGVREGTAASAVLASAPALGIAGQFLDDIQVDFMVKATQADRRSVSLTAPRLTFTNGQISNIYVATQTAFVSDLSPLVSESSAAFDPDLDVVSEGVRMVVEGYVSADRRYVTMNVDAAVSKIERFAQAGVTAVAGGQLVSSADTESFIQLPTVTVTRVATTVTVPDQGTILLGGQRLVNQREVETGVPVLSKIPILNRLFSNRISFNEEQTLLILIKPTVIIQSEQEERNFPGLLDSLRTGIGG
jgi:type II secretory pathway component GspD/PulD (secretin)